MVEVRLDPMTTEEYADYYREGVASYAEAHVAAESWPPEQATQWAIEQYATVLPDGKDTPDHHLYIARDGGSRVGMIWFAERAHGDGRLAYIYDIKIDAHLRGRGYGAAVMQAAEREILSRGIPTVRLHVFGNNRVARSLYDKLGYHETNVVMTKTLDGPQ